MSESRVPPAGGDAGPDQPRGGHEADRRVVKKGLLVVVLAIVVSLAWYLVADRYTPYTTQARVEGFVVGVAPQVAGTITRVWVRNNEEVKEGQPLFEIDRTQYELALVKAQSDLEHARRQVGAGSRAVEAARANLLAAQANERRAQQDLARLQRLRTQDPGTISIRRLDFSRASLDQARAQVKAAEAGINQAIEQMGGADASRNSILAVAMVGVEKAELDLDNTIVKASALGVITDLRADVGQFAATGYSVMTLVAVHDLWVNAEFTENNLGHMDVGTPVEVLFDVMPGKVFSGKVRSLGLGVGTGISPPAGNLPSIRNDRDWLRQSQRFPVIIQLDANQNPDLTRLLRVGSQASVIAYSEGTGLMKLLGKLYIRMASWLAYLY